MSLLPDADISDQSVDALNWSVDALSWLDSDSTSQLGASVVCIFRFEITELGQVDFFL